MPGPASANNRSAQTLRTFCACKPFGPWATSNSTVSPSARLRKPSAWIAVKWTNTSGPDSCAIKPKPFASLNHFTLPLAILLRPQHNGARPRTGTTHATAVVGRAQTKIRETFGPRGSADIRCTVPRMLEPRAKVLTPPYPVNRDCRFVPRPLLRHHRNTSDRADGAITSVSPLTAVGWRLPHVAARATVVSCTATAHQHHRTAGADRQSRRTALRRRSPDRRQNEVHRASAGCVGTSRARCGDWLVRGRRRGPPRLARRIHRRITTLPAPHAR